jgi:hypothetical protein
MRRLVTHIVLAGALIALAAAAGAVAIEDVVIETWVGTGGSRALLVVDFGPESFAFGYRFDGSKTGFDMVNDIATATDLDIVDDTEYGGHLINTFGYHGYYLSYDSHTWSSTHWWEYWTSPDGDVWTSSWVGCGDRTLVDGTWDGWTWSPAWPAVGPAPDVPLVPEPSSLAALCSLAGLAASIKLLRRR